MYLILAAIIPVLIILVFYYFLDRFNKEPLKLLWKLFLLGCLSVIPILIIGSLFEFINPFVGEPSNLYDAFIIAALSEEVIKWYVVYRFAFKNDAFDEKLDGIIYAVFVSMGFAVIENILYVSSEGISVAILRAFTAIPAHMFFGVFMGYYLSLAKFSNVRLRKRFLIKSIFYPVILHGVYDYLLMSNYKLLLLFFIPLLIWMFINIKRRIREYYNESAEKSLSKL